MAGMVELRWEGLEETRALIRSMSDRELANRLRRGVYAGAKVFQAALKVEAAAEPSGNLPHSFTKVRAPRRSTSGGAFWAWTRPVSPLFNIFEPGARPHQIAPGHEYHERARITRGPGRGRFTSGKISRVGGGRRGGMPVMMGPKGSDTWDQKGRKRGARFFATHPVRHPGMFGRPILEAAFMARASDSEEDIAEAIFWAQARHPNLVSLPW